ncbi:MAG: hypothetical protein LBP53_05680 [Candidatus Peribacteria bacterium]|nr:hypothetical protein [Candidatus Peribacteria bacterium]
MARNDYLPPSALLSLQVMTKHSQLFSERTLQSVAHKAILTALSTEKTALNTPVPIDIFLSLEDNQLNVWLNTSGASLHQRGRRKQTGPAPLKENLAAAMLLFSGWKFKAPLRDPFCGSGTIVIEAALLAKNLAPGLQRTFAFQSLKTFDSNLRNHLVQQAQQSVFSHPYQLMGSDINADVLVYAKQNAERANVAELITREQSDFSSASLKNLASDHSLTPRILTNPPYGKRIATGEELLPLYQKLSTAFQSYAGGVISAYPSIDTLFPASAFSHKSRYNGAEKVDFYYKKPLHS